MDSKKSKNNGHKLNKKVDKKPDVSFGGQAVIEGVVMRSPNFYSIATLKNKKIKVKLVKEPTLSKKFPWNIFIVRGVVNLFQMLGLGMKALIYSTNEMAEKKDEKITPTEAAVSIIISFAFAIGIFVVIPFFLAKIFADTQTFLFNVIDGIIRILFFMIYIYVMQFAKDVKRVFQFHGAEHTVINAYECNKKLTIENVKKFSSFHPRCGTSFVFIVLIVSIIVFSLIIFESTWAKILGRIILIPIIAGISYEFLKMSSRMRGVMFKIMTYPGKIIQKITAQTPDEQQIKVAIAALNAVIDAEKKLKNQ